ncbi:hypothetical protein [Sphingomonas sp.]|jgi:DNA-binding XRE family transcriptional regulator|uniref:hypothetical protein n=1 Tax=Sphingomonas sp. TaxID=28214 RepID=UPI002EDA8406
MPHPNLIRFYRIRSALTQDELVDLLDLSQSTLSEMELLAETTRLETALALQVVFGMQPRHMFAALYAKIETAVMARAAELDEKLRHKTDAKSQRKLRTLSAMVKRATTQPDEL